MGKNIEQMKPLKTNMFINYLKLGLFISGMLLGIKLKQKFYFYGVEEAVFYILLICTLLFYRFSFYAEFVFGSQMIQVIMKESFYGYKYISIKDNNTMLIKKASTKERDYTFEKGGLVVKISMPKQGQSSCTVSKITPY